MRVLVACLFLVGCSGSGATVGEVGPSPAPSHDATPDDAPEADAGTDATPDVVFYDGQVCSPKVTYVTPSGLLTEDYRYDPAGPACDNECGAGGSIKYVTTDGPGTQPNLQGCTEQRPSGAFCCPVPVCFRDKSFDAQCAALNQPGTAYACTGPAVQPPSTDTLPNRGQGCEAFNGTGDNTYCCP